MSIVRKTEPTLQCGRHQPLVKFGPLHPATKLLLQRFFAPWNDELRRLLEAKGVATVPGYGFTPGNESKEVWGSRSVYVSNLAVDFTSAVTTFQFACCFHLNFICCDFSTLRRCLHVVVLIFFIFSLFLVSLSFSSSTRRQPHRTPKGCHRQKSASAAGHSARPTGSGCESQGHDWVLVVAL